ncbi:Alpha/Beta hydrolase protein [Mycena galericulata]|nr:Alpha/Beta hydrolase protein [Mycena galericulata]
MADPVIANPPGDCCLNCFPHEGTPVGKFITVTDVGTYITRPPTPAQENRIILYFPDVWGIDTFINGQLLCDYYASQGFLVLAIDYFRGDPVHLHRKDRDDTTTEPGFDYEAWKNKHMAFAEVAVPKWIDAVKVQFGTPETKYAVVGYCFGMVLSKVQGPIQHQPGAPFVVNALAESTSTASVGAFGHPAFLNESHFVPSHSGPLFLSCAETDHTFPAFARHRAEELLTTRKRTFQIQLFSGVEHGFALRGNMEDAYERYTKEESASGIVRWFKQFM